MDKVESDISTVLDLHPKLVSTSLLTFSWLSYIVLRDSEEKKEKSNVYYHKAIDSFLLSCKIEGKSYGTIECYADKLKGSLWYVRDTYQLESGYIISTEMVGYMYNS